MTVRELIDRLSMLDPNLDVVMSMNNEYVSTVTADMVYVGEDAEGVAVVYIDDTEGY